MDIEMFQFNIFYVTSLFQLTLGTSDVFYLCSSTPIPNLFGHVLIGALDPNSYITMIG